MDKLHLQYTSVATPILDMSEVGFVTAAGGFKTPYPDAVCGILTAIKVKAFVDKDNKIIRLDCPEYRFDLEPISKKSYLFKVNRIEQIQLIHDGKITFYHNA